ncbi:MAG: LD-carboxypeptidase [Cyanobacteria bacterium Co-bin8]|nr:LD-carboxypeptidase [Cyanobacteria bacterium Co-bin8]
MRRRQFLGSGAIAGITVGLTHSPLQARATPTLLKPAPLRPGDTLGIISPAGATFQQEELDIVVDAVRGLGLVPRVAPHAMSRYGYLAGTDEERAADLNAFFADPTIKALMPIRGDWGSARILPYLNYDLIRQNPKVLVGFSDITALLLGIHAQTGLVTFHGPHGLTAWRPDQTQPFRQLLFEGAAQRFENPRLGEDADRLMQTRGRIQTITPGQATGKLLGGNLSVVSGIVGSPYMPETAGAILFLEDLGESLYRVDRMLTQLKLAGVFDGLAGFIFGQCARCGPGQDYGSLTLEEILQDHVQPLGIPAWSGAWIGHVEPMWTLPLGSPVRVDATAGTIQMMEPAVG